LPPTPPLATLAASFSGSPLWLTRDDRLCVDKGEGTGVHVASAVCSHVSCLGHGILHIEILEIQPASISADCIDRTAHPLEGGSRCRINKLHSDIRGETLGESLTGKQESGAQITTMDTAGRLTLNAGDSIPIGAAPRPCDCDLPRPSLVPSPPPRCPCDACDACDATPSWRCGDEFPILVVFYRASRHKHARTRKHSSVLAGIQGGTSAAPVRPGSRCRQPQPQVWSPDVVVLSGHHPW
jgi:hypothetical protein